MKATYFIEKRIAFVLLAVALIFTSSVYRVDAAAADGLTASGYVHMSGPACLMSSPSTKASCPAVIPAGTGVVIYKEVFTSSKKTDAKHIWYLVIVNGMGGYIRSDYISNVTYGYAPALAKKKTSCYKGAGESMAKKGTIKKKKLYYIVMTAQAKGSKKKWYKILKGSKYYYVPSSQIKVGTVTPAPAPLPTIDDQTPYARAVAQGAASWAISIANDNSFHYGNNKHASHNGCYFCGTQPLDKQKYVVQWQKTYCCNPFVTAAYAHGGNEPFMLSLCKNGKSYMAPEFEKCALFKSLGHPDQSTLKVGDILTTSKHVAIYVGNGKLAEAATFDNGKPGSSSWNNSIRVCDLTASRYAGFNRGVFRYIGQ